MTHGGHCERCGESECSDTKPILCALCEKDIEIEKLRRWIERAEALLYSLHSGCDCYEVAEIHPLLAELEGE